MDLGEFLYFKRWLTVREYVTLRVMQNPVAYGDYNNKQNTPTFSSVYLDDSEDLSNVRLVPFGELIQRNSELLRSVSDRSGMEMDALIQAWHAWHLKNLEPICTYSLLTKIGKELYRNQEEKKLVGRYVAQHFVRDGDNVALPEGSSSLYVGLGIACHRMRVRIITSNDPIIRETRDNPTVAAKFREVNAIGGQVDFVDDDGPGHGGVFGPTAQQQFQDAILSEPRATVVIMSVSGLLPKEGPYALDGDSVGAKHDIIHNSLSKDRNVRALVFVSDYTKHLPSKEADYGVPIFTPKAWLKMLDDHAQQIAIVTSPPPALRRLMREGGVGNPVERDVIESNLKLPDGIDQEYNQVAISFGRYMRVGDSFDCKFKEAVSPTATLTPANK
jgi:hypothetical protein